MKHRLISIIGTLLFFTLSGVFLVWAQERNKDTYVTLYRTVRLAHIAVPSTDSLKFTSLGFRHLQADIQWLRLVQHVGANVLTSGYQKHLTAFAEVITDLSPQFTDAYILPLLLLPADQALEKVRLGEKGIAALCDDTLVETVMKAPSLVDADFLERMSGQDMCRGQYLLPSLMAYTLFEELGDHARAAQYYFIAWHTAGAPGAMERLTAMTLSQAGAREIALTMWVSMAEHASNDTERDYALMKLQREKNLMDIEAAMETYFSRYGEYPEQLAALVDARLLEADTLEDPFSSEQSSFVYTWDNTSAKASVLLAH